MKLLFNFFELNTGPELSDASSIDECDMRSESETGEHSFQSDFRSLFSKADTSREDIRLFLASCSAIQSGADLEGRSAPDPSSMATPFQIDLSTSHFTPSEVLLQRLASKRSWTEAELAQVIDMFRSPHFHSDDVGLDLTRKVI